MNEAYAEALRNLGLKVPVESTPGQGTLVQRTTETHSAQPVVFSEFLDGVADPHGIGMQRYLDIAHNQGSSEPASHSIPVEEFHELLDDVFDPHGTGSRYHRIIHQQPSEQQEQPRIP